MKSTPDEFFRVVPQEEMPLGPPVAILEIDGEPLWLLREGTPLPDLVRELNFLTTHLVSNGLWKPQRGDDAAPPRMQHAG